MLILGYLIGLNTLNIIFFHHDISYKVSSDSFITAMKLPLLYLKDLSLWLINMSVVQWIKLVSWKWGCESTNKISKFFLLSVLVSLEWCKISHKFFAFSHPIDRLPFFSESMIKPRYSTVLAGIILPLSRCITKPSFWEKFIVSTKVRS